MESSERVSALPIFFGFKQVFFFLSFLLLLFSANTCQHYPYPALTKIQFYIVAIPSFFIRLELRQDQQEVGSFLGKEIKRNETALYLYFQIPKLMCRPIFG